jgi:hypothetical protein
MRCARLNIEKPAVSDREFNTQPMAARAAACEAMRAGFPTIVAACNQADLRLRHPRWLRSPSITTSNDNKPQLH